MNWLPTLFILAVAYLAVFLEGGCDLPGHWFGTQIDLLPALMVYTSLTHGLATIVLLAVCGGLWFDSLSLNPLGASVLPLLAIGLMIYQSRDLLLRRAHVCAGGAGGRCRSGATAGNAVHIAQPGLPAPAGLVFAVAMAGAGGGRRRDDAVVF